MRVLQPDIAFAREYQPLPAERVIHDEASHDGASADARDKFGCVDLVDAGIEPVAPVELDRYDNGPRLWILGW